MFTFIIYLGNTWAKKQRGDGGQLKTNTKNFKTVF